MTKGRPQVHVVGLPALDVHTLLDLSLSLPAGPVNHCCSIPVHAVARPHSVNCISIPCIAHAYCSLVFTDPGL